MLTYVSRLGGSVNHKLKGVDKMKKVTFLVSILLVFALSISTFAVSFSDLQSNHWAYDAVNKLVAAGIVEGFPDGTFRPDESFTREQMAVVVSRVLVKMNEEQEALADSMGEDISSLLAND